jgi:hypothetical protein
VLPLLADQFLYFHEILFELPVEIGRLKVEHFGEVQHFARQVAIIMFVETGYGDVAYQGDRRILVVSEIRRKEIEDREQPVLLEETPQGGHRGLFVSCSLLSLAKGSEKAVYKPSRILEALVGM